VNLKELPFLRKKAFENYFKIYLTNYFFKALVFQAGLAVLKNAGRPCVFLNSLIHLIQITVLFVTTIAGLLPYHNLRIQMLST
jgi:hypothetical protein